MIVVGLGAMGSATVYELTRRGQRVLGLEAYERGHTRGASHGRSRIFRQAYTSPAYVPLAKRSYLLWRDLEEVSGRPLLTMTGMLLVGRPGTDMIIGPIESALAHDLPYELLTPADVAQRYPGFRLSDQLVAVYEPGAGFLRPEECIGAFLDLAACQGAALHHQEPVGRWAADGAGVRVETAQHVYTAARLVITPGPWAGTLLAELELPLTVQRVVNVHVEPRHPDLFAPTRCPVFGWDVPEGQYYGFPALPGEGMKLGRNTDNGVCTPDTIERTVTEAEIGAFVQMLKQYMPQGVGPITRTLTCIYTNTPDRHFVIDRHPVHAQVVYGCGFSGHGFKFASVIGEILCDLTLQGTTPQPIAFLSAARFGASNGTTLAR